jgi:CRP-like cAMP-binding protein
MFSPLPPAALEALAAALQPVQFAAGSEIVRVGDPGDRFYLLAVGEVEVDADPPAVLGPGDFFGEIALLRGTPRTATVRARTGVEGYALEGAAFIAAVTGHAGSARAADGVVASRLGRVRLSH